MDWHPEDDEDLTEDWGESLDDAGGDFYEDRIGDVQDRVEECIEAEERSYQYDDEYGYDQHGWRSQFAIADDSERRKDAILRWVVTSKFAEAVHGGPPGPDVWVRVLPGRYGRLRNGRRVEVVSWLRSERVHLGSYGGWLVRTHRTPDGWRFTIRRKTA